MNCDNCGKDEVSFEFTSNFNGNITEKHLCADCADKLGFAGKLGFADGKADRNMNRPDLSFEEIFTELFGGRPNRRMMNGYGMVFPTFIIPTFGVVVQDESGAPPERSLQAEEKAAVMAADTMPEIDEEMKRRREINVLREQMNTAAREENFEKAAALRDSIRRLENSSEN